MKPRTLYRMCMDGTLFRKIEAMSSDGYGKAEIKLHHEEPIESVQFCLNCTRKKCSGFCDDLRRFKRDNGIGGKYKTANKYMYNGVEYTALQLADMAGVTSQTMRMRLNAGMSVEEAIAAGNAHADYNFRRVKKK